MPTTHVNPNSGTRYTLPRDARRYLGIVNSLSGRGCDVPPCEYGHFGCAAWEGGPCSAEVAAMPTALTVGQARLLRLCARVECVAKHRNDMKPVAAALEERGLVVAKVDPENHRSGDRRYEAGRVRRYVHRHLELTPARLLPAVAASADPERLEEPAEVVEAHQRALVGAPPNGLTRLAFGLAYLMSETPRREIPVVAQALADHDAGLTTRAMADAVVVLLAEPEFVKTSEDGRYGLTADNVLYMRGARFGMPAVVAGSVWDAENFETAVDAVEEETRVLYAQAREEFAT